MAKEQSPWDAWGRERPSSNDIITIERDESQPVNLDYIKALPLPEVDSESWTRLVAVIRFLAEVSPTQPFGSLDETGFFQPSYQLSYLLDSDNHHIIKFSLLNSIWRLDQNMFRSTTNLQEMPEEASNLAWQKFVQLRQDLFTVYEAEMMPAEHFYMVKSIAINNVTLPLKPNVKLLGGADKWGVQRFKYKENGRLKEFAIIKIPDDLDPEQLIDFIESQGFLLSLAFDPEKMGDEDPDSEWNFDFPFAMRQGVHTAIELSEFSTVKVTKDEKVRIIDPNAVEDDSLLASDEDEHENVEKVGEAKLVSLPEKLLTTLLRLTLDSADSWELARIIRWFRQKLPSQTMIAGFEEHYQTRLDHMMKVHQGEAFFGHGSIWLRFSAFMQGKYDEESWSEPNADGVSEEEPFEAIDLGQLFKNPLFVRQMLEFFNGEKTGQEFTTFLNEFDTIVYQNDEAVSEQVQEILEYPLQEAKK